jgi:tetratricopeptide (TPR) repeat protein
MQENDNIKVFRKTIKQHYFDKTNEEIARVSTLKKIELELSKEVGEYISTNTVISNSKIVKDDIIAISSSILNTKIVNEVITKENDQYIIELTIESTIDKIVSEKQIKNILESESLIRAIKEFQLSNNNLMIELAKLNLHIKKSTSEMEKVRQEIKKQIILGEAIKYFNSSLKDISNNDLENASIKLKEAIKLNPDFMEAYTQLANIYIVNGNYEKGIENYKIAIKIDENDYLSYYNLGVIYYKIGKNDKEAITYFTKALEINPYHTSSLYNIGVIFSEKYLDYNNSIKYFDRALETNPDFSKALANKCHALMLLKDFDLALQNCNKALEIDPNEYNIYKIRGSLYKKLKEYQNSINDYKKYLEKFPNNPLIYYFIAGNMEKLGIKDNAIEYYTKAINLNPEFKQAYNSRGLLHVSMNNIIDATYDAKKACEFG